MSAHVEQEQSAVEQSQQRIRRIKASHLTVARFLTQFRDLLSALSEGAMVEKLGEDENLPHLSFWTGSNNIHITVHGRNQRDTMRIVRKAVGGKWTKGGYGETFSISRYWGDDHNRIYLTVQGERDEVCQRVVTGTEQVTIPAVEYQPARVETQETVEWVCGNLLD